MILKTRKIFLVFGVMFLSFTLGGCGGFGTPYLPFEEGMYINSAGLYNYLPLDVDGEHRLYIEECYVNVKEISLETFNLKNGQNVLKASAHDVYYELEFYFDFCDYGLIKANFIDEKSSRHPGPHKYSYYTLSFTFETPLEGIKGFQTILECAVTKEKRVFNFDWYSQNFIKEDDSRFECSGFEIDFMYRTPDVILFPNTESQIQRYSADQKDIYITILSKTIEDYYFEIKPLSNEEYQKAYPKNVIKNKANNQTYAIKFVIKFLDEDSQEIDIYCKDKDLLVPDDYFYTFEIISGENIYQFDLELYFYTITFSKKQQQTECSVYFSNPYINGVLVEKCQKMRMTNLTSGMYLKESKE